VVVGDRRFPAALIVPAFDVLGDRLASLGLPPGDRARSSADPTSSGVT
jgi:hypothetical protein